MVKYICLLLRTAPTYGFELLSKQDGTGNFKRGNCQ